MAAYLTPDEAHTRLLAYEIDALPSLGSLEAASRRIDGAGPFKGARLESDQGRAFPRTYTYPGDTEDEVPEAVLDACAIGAHNLTPSTQGGGGHKPGISSISHSAAGSITYATPKMSNEQYLMQGLLKPYQRQTGTIY